MIIIITIREQVIGTKRDSIDNLFDLTKSENLTVTDFVKQNPKLVRNSSQFRRHLNKGDPIAVVIGDL